MGDRVMDHKFLGVFFLFTHTYQISRFKNVLFRSKIRILPPKHPDLKLFSQGNALTFANVRGQLFMRAVNVPDHVIFHFAGCFLLIMNSEVTAPLWKLFFGWVGTKARQKGTRSKKVMILSQNTSCGYMKEQIIIQSIWCITSTSQDCKQLQEEQTWQLLLRQTWVSFPAITRTESRQSRVSTKALKGPSSFPPWLYMTSMTGCFRKSMQRRLGTKKKKKIILSSKKKNQNYLSKTSLNVIWLNRPWHWHNIYFFEA